MGRLAEVDELARDGRVARLARLLVLDGAVFDLPAGGSAVLMAWPMDEMQSVVRERIQQCLRRRPVALVHGRTARHWPAASRWSWREAVSTSRSTTSSKTRRAGDTLAGTQRAAGALPSAATSPAVEEHGRASRRDVERAGALDCVVNNARRADAPSGADLPDTPLESYDRVNDTNARGTFFLTQRIARRMIDAATPSGGMEAIRDLHLVDQRRVRGAGRKPSIVS